MVLARCWWVVMHGWIESRYSSVTRAALLVHVAHGCVLSGTLASPVWRLCCVVFRFGEMAAERIQGGLYLGYELDAHCAPHASLGAFQGGSGRR